MLAQTRLQILMVPNGTQHEANALGLGARQEHDAVADNAVAQQGRSMIEEHEVEPVARHVTTERIGQPPDRILGRGGASDTLVVEQHRDIDVALAPYGAARPASVQIGDAQRGIETQTPRKTLAKAGEVFLTEVSSHVHPSLELPVTPAVRSGNQG